MTGSPGHEGEMLIDKALSKFTIEDLKELYKEYLKEILLVSNFINSMVVMVVGLTVDFPLIELRSFARQRMIILGFLHLGNVRTHK